MSALSETDIQRVVKAFYAAVRQDDLLAPIFASRIKTDDWDRHEAKIADFWSSIFLKTGRYKGNPMVKHAALPNLTPEHFNHWLALFRRTADDQLEAEKANIMHAMATRIAESLQMGLAFNYDKLGRADHPFQAFGIRRSHSER